MFSKHISESISVPVQKIRLCCFQNTTLSSTCQPPKKTSFEIAVAFKIREKQRDNLVSDKDSN